MEKFILKISMLCFLSLIFINNSFGQTATNDSIYLQVDLKRIIENFDKSIGQQSRLYNGPEYLHYNSIIKGNAYFPYDTNTWEPGEILYDGIIYKNIPMVYDIFKDAVVVLLYNKFSMYTLLNKRVQKFSFANHHFIRIEADSLVKDRVVSAGFYDQLYSGKIDLLAKRIKTIQNSSTTATAMETYFLSKDYYYIKKENIYYKINTEGSILSVFKDKKSTLQQYIRANNIRFKNNKEDAMVKIVSYYDHLTN